RGGCVAGVWGACAVVERLAADAGRLGWRGGAAVLGHGAVVDGGRTCALGGRGGGRSGSRGGGVGPVPVPVGCADAVDGGFGPVPFGDGVDPVAVDGIQLLLGV